MTNILIIHQSAELYGSDKVLLLLLQNLDRSKYTPVVVLPSNGPLKEELLRAQIIVAVCPVIKLSRRMFTPKNLLKIGREVGTAVKILDDLHSVHNFKIIYSNTLAVLLGVIYAAKRNIKHLWHVHEIIVHPKVIAKLFPKILYRYADVVVCNSHATAANLFSHVPALQYKTVTIHNGIAPPVALPNRAIKSDFNFTNSDIVITLVGRISRLKGHRVMLRALKIVRQHNQNVKLLFVGSPVHGQEFHLAEIQQMIITQNFRDTVIIQSFTEDLAPVWDVTDIAVMPSTEAESFGLVALEAMFRQKPVVGSNHGGLTEIIVHGSTGYLVEPDSDVKLAAALQLLIDDPALRNTFGENGYHRALDKFSLQSHVQKFEKILEDLIK